MKTILTPLAALAALLLAAAPEPPARQTFRPVDDGRALVNPYMGWTCHFYSNVPTNYGSHLAPADALDWFEGCSVVYLRIPWAFIEPEEGKFQWSILDTPAQRWISRGKQVAFRFTTSENWIEYAIPKWVEAAGAKTVRYRFAKGVAPDGDLVDPIYDDPIYLAKLENFLKAAAARYDNNPDVAFIDVGTFGLWGEGHTLMTQQHLSREEIERLTRIHIDLHRRCFPHTQLVISDDVIGPDNVVDDHPLMQYARSRGVSFRDDSILVNPKHLWYHDRLAQRFWPTMPVVLEHEHYHGTQATGSWSREKLLQAVEDHHASYLSIHFWPHEFYAKEKPVVQAINRRIGYRFVFPRIEFPAEVKPGAPFTVTFEAANAGVAPCYFDLFPAFTLIAPDGGIGSVLTIESVNLRELPVGPDGQWPVKTFQAELCINDVAPALPPGEYQLCLSLGRHDGTPTVRMPYDDRPDRRVPLGTVKVVPGDAPHNRW